jgi:tyrosinase
MKLTYILKTFILLITGLQVTHGAQTMEKDTSSCTKPCVRKEIREMTPDEFINFIDAFKKVKQSGFWDHLTRIHFISQSYAHSTPIFLPYHRLLLELMEKEMQKYYPGLCMPYWNWALDSQNPEKSIVFTEVYFGGNGAWPSYDVVTGPFANMPVPYPRPGKLKRRFNNGNTITPLLTPENLMDIIDDSKSYNEFNLEISLKPHADVHDYIAYDYYEIGNIHLSTMASPADPIFYLHHCFLDNLWWNWQKKNGALGLSYDGVDASKFDNIIPWGIPVYKMLNTTSYGTCYIYPDYKVNLPKSVEVPLENISNKNQSAVNMRSSLRTSKVKAMPLRTLIELVSKGEIKGESVETNDRKKLGKARTLNPTSPNILKMFKIKPEDEKRQREHFDLINRSLNIVSNFKSVADLTIGDPMDTVPKKLKDWSKKFIGLVKFIL